ncbi:deoxyribose-phosphate aldolase [Pseudarthrobacter phenanthrenivorans]|uniref:Deoxyribose-phosphate aldolase n=1 Tax=Pseudarthrobacter phenanthrenivorans TaxID=361575 RepID=A0A3B0FYL8_PSEPS|nr:deoxyribose-phosphate aldolase [Pseudarthrobacter phenanthrenivorans]RKO24889.1 deoxyribose-phosphate aldolase [Pseudarthrobacter phenanthrenivorans]TPV51502.1 deoxyribose-phosphate aldolase [Pseudarthrobacter phenanthrenivorans]
MSNEATPSVQADAAGTAGSGSIASFIDHTLLKPEAGEADILKVCAEAAEYGFKSVCVNPIWVKTVKNALKGSGVLTCSVVGFPLGATPTDVKTFEARGAVLDGADEVDMVINIAAARAGDKGALIDDITAVAEAVHAGGAILKVIIETGLLADSQKVLACEAAVAAGADFVKTSTGFNGGGATVEDIALMRKTVGPGLGVKASGGVRSLEDAQAMIAAGATRIGASSGIAIVKGEQGSSAY